MDFGRVACTEEISYRQKSRCLWLKEGDRNTKFFHWMANAHMRRNQIGSLKINGATVSTDKEVKEGIVEFYRKLYQEGAGLGNGGLD